MPPKSKRKRQLEDSLVKAREEKRKHESGEDDHSNVVENKADFGDDALDTEDDSVDPSFDLNNSMKLDNDHMNWVMHLDRDDKVSLGLFL